MKTPLLLLHGALGSEKQLFPLRKLLSETREVYTLNFEGHGDFKSESNFSISLFRENVVSFLKEKNFPKVDIFGYSMGGYVALDLAYNHPNLVMNIITLGTKFSWNPTFAATEIKKLNPEKIQEKVPAFAAHLEKLHGKEDWRKVVLNTASFMQDLGNNPTLGEAQLNKISNRVLICLGKLDKMSTVEESVKTSEALKNGSFKAIENFKHPIETIPIDELAEIINTFLEQ